jgi:hypothetical protein
METGTTLKKVLEYIEDKKQEFAQLPLFDFLQDTRIDPRQRLVFAPCLSPLVLGFAELCTSVLREEPTDDPIQTLINQHTYEEQNHWQWLLEDIQTLDLDKSLSLTDALRFIWGDETRQSRNVYPKMWRYSFRAEPLQKLVVMEVAEATANVFFPQTELVIHELKGITKKQYRYFGGHHIEMEDNHNIKTHNVFKFLEGIEISEEKCQKFCRIVDELFDAYSESMSELLVYATQHSIEASLQAA